MFIIQLILEKIYEFTISNLLSLGSLGLVFSFVAKFIPQVWPYKRPIQIASVIILIIGSYLQGGINKEKEFQQKIVEMQIKLDEAEKYSKQESSRVEEEVNKRLSEIKGKVNETKKQIDKHKTVIDSECKLSDVARMLYNRSINNEVSRGTEESDDSTTSTRTVKK